MKATCSAITGFKRKKKTLAFVAHLGAEMPFKIKGAVRIAAHVVVYGANENNWTI